jgi:hypothetical protein
MKFFEKNLGLKFCASSYPLLNGESKSTLFSSKFQIIYVELLPSFFRKDN